MKKEKTCPFCQAKINAMGKHLIHCKQIPTNLSNDEIKLKGIESYVYENFLIDLVNDYENNSSLPELRKKYNIDYKNIIWLLKYSGIKLRSLSESQKIISVPKIKQTLKIKYGENIVNVGQLPDVREKVKNTCIKKYGVDNIWKTKDYYSKHLKKYWENMSIADKEEIMRKKWVQGGYISKIEIRIYEILKQLFNNVESQFIIDGSNHKYDICVHDNNTIFEINGDYWHMNPNYYEENSILKIGSYEITAKEKWELDKKHIEYAKQHNYNVCVLWENDIKDKTDDEIKIFINKMLLSN